jgi:hypothetical protein
LEIRKYNILFEHSQSIYNLYTLTDSPSSSMIQNLFKVWTALFIAMYCNRHITLAFLSTNDPYHPPSLISSTRTFALHSLKPAAEPLLASGKALARSGELLIDLTATADMDMYGGGLSATGANIRNAGDCIAQAAASCRFKTAMELVCDELREAGTCLLENGNDHLRKAVDDASVDGNVELKSILERMIPIMLTSGQALEDAGAGVMKKESVVDIGKNMVLCGDALEQLAMQIGTIQTATSSSQEGQDSKGRMLYAAEMIKLAGNNLMGAQPESKKGKGWLKG